MSIGNRYRMSPTEFLKIILCCIDNIPEEKRNEYIKNGLLEYERYKKDKAHYESLSEEEKMKIEIIEFDSNLNKKTENLRKILDYLLHPNTTEVPHFNSDEEQKKINHIAFELFEKIKLYEKIIEDKSNNSFFNPPLTQENINQLALIKLINEYNRLNQNIINYNFFMKALSAFYKYGEIEDIENQNVIKTSILMFLLECDYEKNADKYERHNVFVNAFEYKENTQPNGKDDNFTVKAKENKISKMLRDAASHGEFYIEEPTITFHQFSYSVEDNVLHRSTSTIRIENSEVITRICFHISYEELYRFVMDNLSKETKEKYSFLATIVESQDITELIYSPNGISKDGIKEIMILMLHNIVQYNTEHHFKSLQMEDKIDMSQFHFYNLLKDGLDITSNLPQRKKMMNIKNALGHNRVIWNGDVLELINEWVPQRGRVIRNKTIITFNDLILWFLQSDLYTISTISQSEYDIMNKQL